MESSPQEVNIDLTPEFKNNLRALIKRYPNLQADLQDVTQELEVGNFQGDRLSGIGDDYAVLKVRVRNSNVKKGKRGGYRVIYQVESPVSVLMLAIYSKSDTEDISAAEIRQILKRFYG
jgi:mRNA-degrading endonuclease RelE of RelBE toxin-antitoxin system